MQNKPRNWTDVQLIISSISVALTLGFWGLLASREKSVAGVAGQVSVAPQANASVSAPVSLLPGQKMYLGASAPQNPSPAAAQPQSRRNRGDRGSGGGGGGGGGGGDGASTHSS